MGELWERVAGSLDPYVKGWLERRRRADPTSALYVNGGLGKKRQGEALTAAHSKSDLRISGCEDFKESSSFKGFIYGFVYKLGSRGLGYYVDAADTARAPKPEWIDFSHLRRCLRRQELEEGRVRKSDRIELAVSERIYKTRLENYVARVYGGSVYNLLPQGTVMEVIKVTEAFMKRLVEKGEYELGIKVTTF